MAAPAWAELQNLDVGGALRIRGRYFHNVFAPNREERIPRFLLPGRALGPQGATSVYVWDDDNSNDRTFVEMDTRLYVHADFTHNVAAHIEFESYDIWGEDFRSGWVTGADMRSTTTNDVEVLHAYVEASDVFGLPLRLRIGRQDLMFDDGWLVSRKSSTLRGLSFDGIRATWQQDAWTVDAFWSRIGYGGSLEQDGNVNFSGIHAEYAALDALTVSGYWYWLRDARSINDTNFAAPLEWVEDLFAIDDYDPVNLHTIGVFLRGEVQQLDYALHASYQFGNADRHGSLFRPFLYGDDGAEYDAWGGDVELGYTFDARFQPRFFVGGAYLGGEDNRDLSALDWLNPFDRPEASMSFNRLFSEFTYTNPIDNEKGLSNFWQVRAGVAVQLTDTVAASVTAAHFEAIDPFDAPAAVRAFGYDVPVAPGLPFLTQSGSTDIGDTVTLRIKYQFSDNLAITFLWDHLFTGDALGDGVFVRYNGTENMGGTASDDADYLYLYSELTF